LDRSHCTQGRQQLLLLPQLQAAAKILLWWKLWHISLQAVWLQAPRASNKPTEQCNKPLSGKSRVPKQHACLVAKPSHRPAAHIVRLLSRPACLGLPPPQQQPAACCSQAR
jgi:hypothetical protein